MALLYPRLLAGQAKPLHREYRELPVAELTRRVTTRHDSAVYVATGGDRVSEDELRSLRESVLDVARNAGFPEEASRTARAAFDIELAALLHSKTDLMPAEAASGDVWAFLALAVLPDVAYWRYPRPPGDRVLATDLTRHVLGRLWWRAHLVHDPGSPMPYSALSILGEAAFDQIYARRKALGGSPHLVRSILRVWDTLSFERLNERDVLRDFLKRLLRLAPFLLFEALGDDELDKELASVASESLEAIRATKASAEEPTAPRFASAPAGREGLVPKPRPAPRSRVQNPVSGFTFLEVCAGAGGLASGLERAGFTPAMLVDNRPVACETLRMNRPQWDVREIDVLDFRPDRHGEYAKACDVDLLSAGLPRLKGAAATNRERDNGHELEVLKATVALTALVQPRALLLENVSNLVTDEEYEPIRRYIAEALQKLGFRHQWFVVNASDHRVPQDRKQGVLVAFQGNAIDAFRRPDPAPGPPVTVGQALAASMASRGWPDASRWAAQADRVAPTLVGGSWDRGGADLGMSGAKRAWARMGVDAATVADEVPGIDFHWDPGLERTGMMALTVEQAACLQGFPDDWRFAGRKTARYRQVANASPPAVGEALGRAIGAALTGG